MNASLLAIDWLKALPIWALLVAAGYVALIASILIFILPASKPNPLPESYFELIAAGRKPWLYRMTMLFDMLTWVFLGGFLVTCAGLMWQASPMRSIFVVVLATGLLAGLIGAGLRLAVNPILAQEYLTKSTKEQSLVVHSYARLLEVINTLFNIGGFLAGVALLLVASTFWSITEFSHWTVLLVGLFGFISIVKSGLELVTGKDFGPLQLLGNISIVVSLVAIAVRFW